MSNEVLIPPWIIPQAETTTLVDDSTSVFRAAYAPGVAQRVSYVEPRLQVKQSFKGLRGFERAAMLAALSRAKGKFATVRALVGYALRGSFPATELFANNDFSAGTSGWTASGEYSISAIDRGIRAKRSQVTAASFAVSQIFSLTPGTPYTFRGFVNAGYGALIMECGAFAAFGNQTAQGMLEGTFTAPSTSSTNVGFFDATASGALAGNYFDAKWASLSRCAQVDNGVNLLLNSDTPGTGTGWTVTNALAGSASAVGPDGATDAWALTETATTAQHFVTQPVTVSSAAADYTASYFAKAGARTWCYIQINDSTHSIVQWFNLSTGVTGTFTGGTNFTFISAYCVDYGNSWKRCILTFRKSSTDTAIASLLGSAPGDAVASFLGVITDGLTTWRASLAPSSVPVQPVQTVASALPAGANQTGNTINVKGLPLSTSGLLLEGDPFEINGELKLCLSALNSDASGIGFISFAPALCRSPSDGDGVIINKPMGKFILAADASWVNDFGSYADIDITLEAINE
jgi:hypothetical protein